MALSRRWACILLLPCAQLAACVAAVAVGAAAVTAYGVIKYKDNEAYRDYKAGVDATWAAVLPELKDMGYSVSQDVEEARRAGGVSSGEADVKVDRVNDEYTRVTVRFGSFETDDRKRRAERLLNGVASRLGED